MPDKIRTRINQLMVETAPNNYLSRSQTVLYGDGSVIDYGPHYIAGAVYDPDTSEYSFVDSTGKTVYSCTVDDDECDVPYNMVKH